MAAPISSTDCGRRACLGLGLGSGSGTGLWLGSGSGLWFGFGLGFGLGVGVGVRVRAGVRPARQGLHARIQVVLDLLLARLGAALQPGEQRVAQPLVLVLQGRLEWCEGDRQAVDLGRVSEGLGVGLGSGMGLGLGVGLELGLGLGSG